MMPKKYYDGFIIFDTLSEHLQGEKLFELIQAFADSKGADAEPIRHGRWIYRNPRVDIATCSCCGDRWGSISVMNYCPSCGAKMDKRKEE